MIINNQQNDIVKSGFDSSKKATINQDKLAKLQYILTKGLYQDPIGSLINEWSANAIDSVVQSGKSLVENPVMVTITDNKFTVKDTGLGISKEDFINVCMNYLTSTKENDNSAIGHFGLGMKVFMALDRSATFTLIKDNVECRFIAYQGDEFMEYDLIYEKETLEPNGVICEISINGWSEKKEFKEKAIKRLSYYDNVVLTIDGIIINNTIVRSEDWQYSTTAPHNSIHICLKDVVYDLNFEQLGISEIDIPIALRFDLNSGLTPVPSRESLIYNTATKELILNKIQKVAEWFVNKHNEQILDEYELLEIFEKINSSDKYVKIANEEFCINDLLQYSTVKPKELKIKGVELEKPEYYWDNRYHIFDEYISLVDYTTNSWVTKRPSTPNFRDITEKDVKLIEVNRTPSGLIKKFLLQKYSGKIKFISKVKQRKLGKKAYNLKRDWDYMYILDFVMKPKNTWRQYISEWQFVENQFKSKIINELNVENSKEYLEWLTKHKEEQKLNRSLFTYQPKSNYKRLNKTAEDITIQLASPKDVGVGCKFVKKAVKITDLNKLYKSTKALHIYFPEEQKERAKEYYELLGAKYSICILSPREIKRLPKIKNFMTETEFIQSRAFCKIMSSIRYQKAIDNFDNTYRGSQSEIVERVLEKFNKQRDILREYTRKNGRDIPNNLLQELKEIAQLQNLYDRSLDDVYNEFVKNTEKYSFISCLQKPRSWDDEEKAKYTKLVNSLLLMKQKYNNFEELEIEIKPKQEETILEEELETV